MDNSIGIHDHYFSKALCPCDNGIHHPWPWPLGAFQVLQSLSCFSAINIVESRGKERQWNSQWGKPGGCTGLWAERRSSSSSNNLTTAPQSVPTGRSKLDAVAPVQQPLWWPQKIILPAVKSRWRGAGGNDRGYPGRPLQTACGYVQMDQLITSCISHDVKDNNGKQ